MHIIETITAIGTMIGAIGAAGGAIAAFRAIKISNRSARVSAHSAHIAARSADNAEKALRRNNRLTSVNIAAQALKEFAADRDMQEIFYMIEYRRFHYGGTWSLRESGLEKPTDKLLRHFAAVALAWDSGFVKEDTLRIVRYYVLKILGDKHIWEYMKNVCINTEDNFSHIKEHPYHVLMKLGEKLKEFPPENVHVVEYWKYPSDDER